MRRVTLTLAASLMSLAMAGPAFASSMPKADFGRANTFGLGVGYSASISLDFPVGGNLSLGGAFTFQSFRSNIIDLRLMYKLLSGKPSLGLLGGVQLSGPSLGNFSVYTPFIGVGLAYPFTNKLTGRLNLAAAIGVGGGAFSGTTASGIELAYEFTPQLEGTIGANGRGDFLGLKLSF
jgi:opacity protein-like surface antigen